MPHQPNLLDGMDDKYAGLKTIQTESPRLIALADASRLCRIQFRIPILTIERLWALSFHS
jgi:hypothetical protein